MLMRMFVANGVARLGGWLDWVAKTLVTVVENPHYFFNLDPGEKVASFGMLGRRFTRPLHRHPCQRPCRSGSH